MSIVGWYYLHENGDLIYKRELGGTVADLRDSSFVKGIWPLDPQNRENAWRIVVEGLAAGANKDRVDELAEKWRCDDADADNYAEHIGCALLPDGDCWCATRLDFVDLQSSPAGFGDTKLEAMAELASALGYKPDKLGWGAKFADLLK